MRLHWGSTLCCAAAADWPTVSFFSKFSYHHLLIGLSLHCSSYDIFIRFTHNCRYTWVCVYRFVSELLCCADLFYPLIVSSCTSSGLLSFITAASWNILIFRHTKLTYLIGFLVFFFSKIELSILSCEFNVGFLLRLQRFYRLIWWTLM